MSVLNWIEANKEWFLDGFGGAAILAIIGFVVNKFLKKGDEGGISQNTTNNNANAYGDNSSSIIGNGNQISVINNFSGKEISEEKNEKSDFSKRYLELKELLNQSQGLSDKEYTDEYISFLLGLSNVKELQKYINTIETPDDAFKEKFVEVFGVNREWIVYGQGGKPFKSNRKYYGNDPIEIIKEGFLSASDKVALVIGLDQDEKKKALFIIKHNENNFEVIPKLFTFDSNVGAGGTRNLVNLYDVINKLENDNLLLNTYRANVEQTVSLFEGTINPKGVLNYSDYKGFIECFLDISAEGIERNSNFLDKDIVEVQKIISSEKGIHTDGALKSRVCSTEDFSVRFGYAFPGVRGIEVIDNPEECINRLKILLSEPLDNNSIWSFRGTSTESIDSCSIIDDGKILINSDEYRVKKICACYSPQYYKKFVYVETEPDVQSGVNNITNAEIDYYVAANGYCREEFAVYKNHPIKRTEYDDGAAIIDGKLTKLNGEAKIRIRFLSPYNFIICAQFNPINNGVCDYPMKDYLNGILKGQNTIEDIYNFIDSLPKHRDNYL